MSTRLLFILLLCFTALRGGAQQRVVQYKPFIDERPWHYGFQIGLHDQGLKLLNNGYINETDGAQWVGENDRQNFGFSVGVLGEWRFTRNLAFRVTPTLHFGSKHLTFRNMATKQELTQDMKTTYIAVPALVKVAGPRYNNFRPYVVGGLDVMYDLTSSKGSYIRTRPLQTFAEVGFGCDFYLPFFKLIPEIKFCFGLNNTLQRNRPDLTDPTQLVFTQSLQRTTPNMVVLTFYFE